MYSNSKNTKQLQLSKNEARESLSDALESISDLIATTYGPMGRRNIFDKVDYPDPFITNDGFLCLLNYEFDEPVYRLAKKILLDFTRKTNYLAGDGTSTTIILASKLSAKLLSLLNTSTPINTTVNRGYEMPSATRPYNPIEMKECLEEVKTAFEKYAKENNIKIRGVKQLEDIAFISSRDKKLAKTTANVVKETGKNGRRILIDPEEEYNFGGDHQIEVIKNGAVFSADVLDSLYFDNQEKLTTELKDVAFAITSKKIDSMKEIDSIINNALEAGKTNIVIIANDYSEMVEANLNSFYEKKRHQEKQKATALNQPNYIPFKLMPLKAPYIAEKQKTMLEDIAAITGARFFNNTRGENIYNIKPEEFGSCEKMTIRPGKVVVENPSKDEERVKDRLSQVTNLFKEKVASTLNSFEFLVERKTLLVGGFARIVIGANSITEAKDIYTRFEDALRSVDYAYIHGVLPGGGVSLARFVNQNKAGLVENETNPNKKAIKNKILTTLQEPFLQLCRSVSLDIDEVVSMIDINNKKATYDFLKRQPVDDCIDKGIIDSSGSVVESVRNAFAVAELLIFTDVLALEKEKESK